MDGFHFEYTLDGSSRFNLHFSLPLSEMPINEQLVVMTQYMADFFLVLRTISTENATPRSDIDAMIRDLMNRHEGME